jgi:glycosyltransferase involved in cell wall biosynthesis
VAPLGIVLDGHAPGERPAGAPPTIGYLARICPEKGLHLLAEAFCRLAAEPGFENLRLLSAGWLGVRDRDYLDGIRERIARAGLSERFEYRGEVDRMQKIELLRSLDVFALPTTYPEAKGLPALEAMANGVPVVVPRHGSFPEMIEATGGGRLYEPASVDELTSTLRSLLVDADARRDLGRAGHAAVFRERSDQAMAESTLAAYRSLG